MGEDGSQFDNIPLDLRDSLICRSKGWKKLVVDMSRVLLCLRHDSSNRQYSGRRHCCFEETWLKGRTSTGG